eukprot:scaffold239099_cov28-Tisochrysis_lutea.AAC.4
MGTAGVYARSCRIPSHAASYRARPMRFVTIPSKVAIKPLLWTTPRAPSAMPYPLGTASGDAGMSSSLGAPTASPCEARTCSKHAPSSAAAMPLT